MPKCATACLAIMLLAITGAAQECHDYTASPHWIASQRWYGGSASTWHNVRGLVAVGAGDTLLFLEGGNSDWLRVLDARDAPTLVEVGSLILPWAYDPYGVAVRGRRAYVGNLRSLQIVSIADPAQPAFVTSITLPEGSKVTAADNLLLRIEESSLRVMGLADPDTAVTLATLPLGVLGRDAALAGGWAYVGTENGLLVIDLTSPAQPSIAATLPEVGWVSALQIGEGRLYACGAHTSVYDLSDPAAPQLLGQSGRMWGDEIAIDGDIVLISGLSEFLLYDWTDPAAPIVRIHGGMLGTWGSGIFLKDGLARVAFTSSNDGVVIQTWQVGETPAPAPLGVWTKPPEMLASRHLEDILGDGTLAYCLFANGNDTESDESRLVVLDVADPSAPALLANIPIPYVSAGRMAKSGSVLLIQGGELIVVDVSTPSAPVVRGTALLMADSRGQNWRVPQIWGNLALVGSGWLDPYDLRWALADITDPDAPQLLGFLPASLQGWGLARAGDVACVVRGDSLLTFDVHDPWHPAPLADIEPALQMDSRMLIAGNVLFLTALESTGHQLLAVDISDAARPVAIGRTWVPYAAWGLAVAGSRLYVAGLYEGLSVVDIADPAQPQMLGTVATFFWTEDFAACDTGLMLTDATDLTLFTYACGPRPPADLPPDAVTPFRPVVLDAPHPNPFNPIVRIPFTLAQPQRARVVVYDLAGRRVATVADQAFAAGQQEVVWRGVDARGAAVASGNYVVRVEGERGRDSRCATLLR